jgi:hypothetical protein
MTDNFVHCGTLGNLVGQLTRQMTRHAVRGQAEIASESTPNFDHVF